MTPIPPRYILILALAFTTGLQAQTLQEQMEALGRTAAQGSHSAIDELESMVNHTLHRQTDPANKPMNRALIKASFTALAEEAGKGSNTALEALKYANGKQLLRSFTVDAFGIAAGMGNQESLRMLLDYKANDFLLSSTVFALQPAAEKNIPEAVDFLVEVIDNPGNKALWHAASQGLVGAAALGNEKAKAALKRYAGNDESAH